MGRRAPLLLHRLVMNMSGHQMKTPFAWTLALGILGLGTLLDRPGVVAERAFLTPPPAALVAKAVLPARRTFQLRVSAPEPLMQGGKITRPLINKGFALNLSAEEAQAAQNGQVPRAALDRLYRQIGREPKDAFFSVSGSGWAAQAQTGWQVDRASTDAAFLNAARARRPQVPVTLRLLAPPRSVSALKASGVVAHVAAGESSFAGSPEFRVHNIRVGSAKLSGLWLRQGAVFDFNASLGRLSAASGFVPGYVISGGTLALEDGGGVCQISTTLFRAAYRAGLRVVERHAHSHQVDYYEPTGFEATVYAPSKNLRFANDTAAPLLIQASWDVGAATLRFDLFGAPPDRRVNISEPLIVSRTPARPPSYMADPSLKVGEIERVDLPCRG